MRDRTVTSALVALAAVVLWAAPASAQKTWTLDADFDDGILSSVQYDSVPDQLQLSETSETTPFIYIANHRYGTLSKVDTLTGREVARYPTCVNNVGNANLCPTNGGATDPNVYCNWANAGHCPSRTAVDLNGDVWVANRAFGLQPSVTKIAGSLDRCIDRDGDGVIETSMDLSGNGRIDLTENANMPRYHSTNGEWLGQEDECVLFTAPVGGVNYLARGLTIDPSNNVWVGMYNAGRVYKLANATGVTLANHEVRHAGHLVNVYGLAADALGYIYNSELGNGRILQIDGATGVVVKSIDTPRSTYGLAVEGNTQVVWLGVWENRGAVLKVDFSGATPTYTEYRNPSWSYVGNTRGVALDGDGKVWVANWNSARLGKFDPVSGTWTASYAVASGPIGVGIDGNGKIWTANQTSNRATRIDPAVAGGARIDSVVLGVEPYSYSDMTGFQLTNVVIQQGHWTVVHDSGSAGTPWGTVSWNDGTGVCPPEGCVPPGTEVSVEVRASDSAVPTGAWTTVLDGVDFTGVAGQFIEIKATLRVTGGGDVSPVLKDLTVQPANQPPVCAVPAGVTLPCSGATAVALDGSGSSDPDGDTLTYAWAAGACGGAIADPAAAATSATIDTTGQCDATCGFTLTVSDGLASASCTYTVEVTDTAPPVVSVGAVTAECNDGAGGTSAMDAVIAAFLASATAVDVCQGVVGVANDAPATFPLGTTDVTFSANDGCGNAGSAIGSVTVADTAAPLGATCPGNDTLLLSADTCEAGASYAATAADACVGAVSDAYTYAFAAVGSETHTYTLADGNGNAAACDQTVSAIDVTAPVVACPADETLELSADTCEAMGTFVATAWDACSGSYSDSHTYGFDAPGSETHTFAFEDESGNPAACDQTVAAVDVTPPTFTAGTVAELWPPNHKYVTVTLAECGGAWDACMGDIDLNGGAGVVTYITSDEPEDVGGGGDGNTNDDMVVVDGHTVQLRAERMGGANGRVYTIHFTLTDPSGNAADYACRVDVPHDQGKKGSPAIDDGPVYQEP